MRHTYDKQHRLLKTGTSDTIREFTYDANGNLVKEKLAAGGMSWQAEYDYNTNDQLTAITYPRSGTTVRYTVNALGRPTSITGYINSVTYWPSGQVRNISYSNGAQSEYGQNSRLWPSSFSTFRSGSSYFNRASYTYDYVGNLTKISDSSDSNYDRSLSYDNMDRLTEADSPMGSLSIAYDGAGNIIRQTINSERLNYQYDNSNRLSALSAVPNNLSTTYNYDALGNITNGSGRTYTYDAAPNLICVNCANSANAIQYTYDGNQKRTSVIKGGVQTYEFHGAHGHVLAEYVPGAPGKLIEYIYLNGKRIAQKESAQ